MTDITVSGVASRHAPDQADLDRLAASLEALTLTFGGYEEGQGEKCQEGSAIVQHLSYEAELLVA
jgi:hypothetical protein